MESIEAALLVGAWERGRAQHPLHRALTLLRVAAPEQGLDALAALGIGERDRRLLELRRRLFGSRFDAVVACPRCSEKLELSFSASDLPAEPEPPEWIDVAVEGQPPLRVRLPSTVDLLEVAAEPPERRVPALLERCAGGTVSGAVSEAIQARMEELDPLSSVQLSLRCPACDHPWTGAFDIASFLWTELGDHVMRLLRETHALARAY